MGWRVVVFKNENSVEAVPHSWYIEESSECFWPPSTYSKEKILKCILNCDEATSEWKVYPVKFLGSYDNFETAQRKAKKATICSDLSSTSGAESSLGRSRRRKSRNPKYLSDSDETSSDFDGNMYPSTKKNIFRNSFVSNRRKSGSCSPLNRCSYNSEDKILTSKSSSSLERGRSRSNSDKTLTPTSSISLERQHLTANSVAYSTDKTARKVTRDEQPLGDEDFKKMVLDELSHLHLKVNNLLDKVNTLVTLRNNNVPLVINNENLEFINKKFPIGNEENLQKVEEWLVNENNYCFLISELKRIGGHSYGQATRKVLYRVLSNDIAQKFSWDGAKGKEPFKHLKIAKGVLDTIKGGYPETTENDIITVIKFWLVKAKHRNN